MTSNQFVLTQNIGGTIFCGCVPCGTAFATFNPLTIIISGFTICGCIPLPDDNTSLLILSKTGITGMFSQNWPGSSIGDLSVQAYGLGDETCTTPIGAPSTFGVVLNLECVGDTIFPEILVPGFDPPFNKLFTSATGGTFGQLILNDLNCGTAISATVDSVQIFPA